ncbi:MAG: CheY-like chemotaxis protein [Cocleimonas sp.]|jgi:CheY-like chemotaxis protein
MPFLDGIKTSEKIRDQYSLEDLPIVLLTADVINIVKPEIKSIGINEVIYKHINGDELIKCVKKPTLNRDSNKTSKVLDIVSDDLLKDELIRLRKLIIQDHESEDDVNIKKYIHQLCGIAGPSSKYIKLWKIAKDLDVEIHNGEYDSIKTSIDQLDKMIIS